jgi:hypothetical protein
MEGGGGGAVFMAADNHYVPLLKEKLAVISCLYHAVRFLLNSV